MRNAGISGIGATPVTTTADTWESKSFDFTVTAAATATISIALTTAGGSAAVTVGDLLYIKNVVIEVLGAVVDLDLGIGKGTYFPDRSSNGFHGEAAVTTGFLHKFERRSGELVIVRKFAHSDISATADTTRLLDLPANCGVVEVEFDRETAFDAGTTLSVGITGTAGKYVNAQAVDATGKALADSASKTSESSSAYTTVWLKKNQATTQGMTTVRARLVIRG